MVTSSKEQFKYIYGPVYSWRLGMSLGIDPLTPAGKRKVCNFDCPYCQLGRTAKFYTERENFVPVDAIINEIKALPAIRIDHYTFSGRGEPTLAGNLGEMIRAVREATGGKIAVITNAGLIDLEDVRRDLAQADLVLAKLDAGDQESFQQVDIPAASISFERVVPGIKTFRENFTGRLALQVMFVKENKHCAARIARLAREINPDEVQLNTPLRPGGAAPLDQEELMGLKGYFQGLPAVCVYEAQRKTVEPFNERSTVLRHGNFRKGVKSQERRASC
ncbi:MAG: radical SAM protein [Candidatus Omnitrophica bacterium]|nr:radical SAM protein [Candidatus Omnitrophota bacterium]